ncbi:competence regulator inhibitor paratox [Streptococcus suis]|uniref:competence regulator inhibitor paratox n=1 Tax=Streptococcus suis TaxID=1307 RepID=UPI00209BE2BD|nr:hypothetical protein [Streptococcus suis]MCO8233549.1 hypothetical protein [Streptococcus suis]HEM3542735.1 hypothetical protein [Streptococcus suis]
MNETLYIFLEAKAKGLFGDTVDVVRKNGKIFDFVLPGEQVLSHEVVTNEPLASVLVEIASY